MTPKEKAKELVKKFICIEISLEVDNIDYKSLECELRYNPKEFALIAVDEILKSGCTFPSNNTYYGCNEEASEYWEQVKRELKEL